MPNDWYEFTLGPFVEALVRSGRPQIYRPHMAKVLSVKNFEHHPYGPRVWGAGVTTS